MKTQIDLLKTFAHNINVSTNDMQGTPYWNKCKKLLKVYLKNNEISEISVNDLSTLIGLKKDMAFKMLIEINKEYFENINK